MKERSTPRRISSALSGRPLVTLAAGTALGVLLGATLFARAARLAMVVLVGFAAAEMWAREGRLESRNVGAE